MRHRVGFAFVLGLAVTALSCGSHRDHGGGGVSPASSIPVPDTSGVYSGTETITTSAGSTITTTIRMTIVQTGSQPGAPISGSYTDGLGGSGTLTAKVDYRYTSEHGTGVTVNDFQATASAPAGGRFGGSGTGIVNDPAKNVGPFTSLNLQGNGFDPVLGSTTFTIAASRP